MKYWCLLLFLLLVPTLVHADPCDNDDDYNQAVALARNIRIIYAMNNDRRLTLTARQVDSSISFLVNGRAINASNGTANLGVFSQGQSIVIEYRNRTDFGCGFGRMITREYLTLPFYNNFRNNALCSTRRDAEVCAYFYPTRMTREEFDRGIANYDQMRFDVEAREIEEEEPEEVKAWYLEYIRYLVGGGISIILITIGLIAYLWRRRARDRGDLF